MTVFGLTAQAGLFTWNSTTGGSWSTQANWSSGVLPTTTSHLAAFTNLDVTADVTVTLDGNQNVGALTFGDLLASSAAGWNINTGAVSGITVKALGTGKAVNLNSPLSGTGTLTVNTTNSLMTGAVLLSAGKITLGNAGASLGTGTLELNGGTFTIASSGTLYNPVTVLAPSTIGNSGNSTTGGTLSGGSILTVAPPTGNELTLDASAANFTGTITLGNGSKNLRINQSGTWGVPNGTLDLGTNATNAYTRATGGGTAYLGALTGGPRTTLTSSDQSSNPGATVTFIVGALNSDATYAGTTSDVGKAQLLALTKVGSGTMTLSGDSNYRGAMRVGAGTLQISGSLNPASFVSVSNNATLDLPGTITVDTVQINSGGTLTGCGAINRNLLNNGTVLADCGAILEISGDVTNNGTMQFLSGSGLAVSGTFVNNGCLTFSPGRANCP